MTETDYYCREFTELEIEIRQLRMRIAARPMFRSATPNGGRPKGESDRTAKRKKHQKSLKDRRAQCIADGICTICQRTKAERGRLCDECYDKERQRMKKRIVERSGRRAACAKRRKVA